MAIVTDVLKLGRIARDRVNHRMRIEIVVRAWIASVAQWIEIELIAAQPIVVRVGRLPTGIEARIILLQDEMIVELKDRVGWIATNALLVAALADRNSVHNVDQEVRLRDETTAGWKDRVGWIATNALLVAATADRNSVDNVAREARLRDETNAEWKNRVGRIAAIALRIVILDGDHSMDRAGRWEDVMIADRDNSTARIIGPLLQVAAQSIAALPDSAAHKDHSMELTVADLVECMDRAVINTLPVLISIDLHLTVIEDRVARNEVATSVDSVAHAVENAAAA